LKNARPKGKKHLWKCPKCGHRFVTRNLWHSCVRVSLASHFRGKDPIVRKLFDRIRALVRRCGPATVYAQKTRIDYIHHVRLERLSDVDSEFASLLREAHAVGRQES